VKFTEHVTRTTVVGARPECPGSSARLLPRTVRISVTDEDATDSSGDEEAGGSCGRRRVRRFVNEVKIRPGIADDEGGAVKSEATAANVQKRKKSVGAGNSGGGKKFRGVRQRPWGKWAAEIRDPQKRVRLWLGTFNTAEEAAMVYDHAAITLRGPDALTNFSNPAPEDKKSSGYNSGEDDSDIKSPSSVLRFVSPAVSQSNDAVCQEENFSIFPSHEDFFPDFENPLPVPDLFDQPDFFQLDLSADMLIGSCTDIGFVSQSWPSDDYFQDFGDILCSDPLVVL
ncbi:hypothetical protein M569_03486, partial [Genlisea aurea]